MIYIDIIQTCMTSVTCTGCPNLNLNNIYIYTCIHIIYKIIYCNVPLIHDFCTYRPYII